MQANDSGAGVTAVVLAAGKGTRMRSAHPKVLHEVLNKPLVFWSVDAAHAAGVTTVVCVIGHGREAVAAALTNRYGVQVHTAVQIDQRGTGHAVQAALDAMGTAATGDLLVLCGDTPHITPAALSELLALRTSTGALVAMWVTHLDDPTGYGRIVRGADSAITAIVEHKDASAAQRAITEVNPGVYCFDGAFLRRALPRLKTENAAGELYLTDVVQMAVAERAGSVAGLVVDAAITNGINDRVQLAAAEAKARASRLTALRLSGVTVIADDNVAVGADVVVGEDTVIAGGVSLLGSTKVGRNVTIHQGCVITDTIIDDDVVVHPYSVCNSAHIRAGAIIGPFARLRPEADVGAGAHVGNFVELKKTTLGPGSKANHLAYLGDAVIGAGVNVGAGTITCNYDGHGKYQTILDDGVFVGSNSTLVAPVRVGAGGYIAAGSVVTDDVPADAVAFARARQSNKVGYAPTVRKRNATKAQAAKAAKAATASTS